ncbi:MAG: ABC transporter substrate-binding protein, partial [Candidatus Hodarchaeota archaeon]
MVAFFLMIIGLAGGAKQASAARKDTLIVGLGELPPTIDIERSTHPMSWLIVTNVGEQYLGFGRKPSDWDRGILILDYSKYDTRAVEKYELSPDSTKLTFHLRRGVKSPSGNELTTKDFYWTMKRGLAMGGTTAYKFANLSMSKNMEESVQVKDDYTITLVAREPTALFLIRHSFPSQIIYDSTEAKKHATASDPWAADYISKNAPTFGPYYITKWTPGREALLEANPNYYKGVPYFKKVILKVIPESSSRLAMIRDGTIDVAYDLSPREIISLKDAKGVKPINVRGVWLNHLVLNDLVVPELKKKPVRQAVNYAINRKKICEMAYYGMAEPMKFIFPSRFPGVLDLKEFPYDYDLKKAKEKLVEAGHPEGFETEI